MKPSADQFAKVFFAEPLLKVYAILDGASVPELLPKLDECGPEYACLYRGEIAPDLAQCAPYLVRLDNRTKFTKWVIEEGWGNHWGVFAASQVNLGPLRQHLRTFLRVRGPDNKVLYFRYYDPRVLRMYLPSCNGPELAEIFGPVASYWAEDAAEGALKHFFVRKGRLVEQIDFREEEMKTEAAR